MTNAEKFEEVFDRELEESRMLSMPSSFNQIIALRSFQIVGVDCADEWKESEYQGEPVIPLSVIEKITTEIEERATYEGIYLDRADVLDIIDNAVKEYTYENIR